MVGKNEQASSAKFFSGTTRRATEGSPQRDKAVAGRLQKAAEKKNSPAGWRGREELDHYLRSVGALAASTRFSALVIRLSREVANSG